ncbi:MAG TPA: MBOAT family O-acyltransferase [Candidatus Paceibacterota bacterium]|nr:MBOAT family O-acyltransferase [Candidatus Paceibacterota bacterium]
MVFNSVTFLVFLAIVLVAYYRLQHRGQNMLLLAASYIFYGWWDWRFLSLLLFTSFFDYWCALWLEGEQRPGRRKLFLSFSMIVNLGVLGMFKYFNFFAGSLEHVLAALGMKATFPVLNVILPVGISFYTFLSMSYTIDVYRGELKAAKNPMDFMLYVAFFPHLVAGPIVRASFLLPQCQRVRVINPTEVINGVWLILMGYVKKVVIADRLAGIVNWGFAQPGPPFADANAWLVIYAFAFQIYGDFSGYSDIARGVSKLMGFELTTNFKAPYLVNTPSAFWQNWHISLSTWLRDYLYIPLGGNRRGPARTYINLMTTMLLGGLWHGAGAAYLLWGLFHGTMLAIHRAWLDLTGGTVRSVGKKTGSPEFGGNNFTCAMVRVATVFLFFHITCIGWLLFRAGAVPNDFSQVQVVSRYLQAMFQRPAVISPLIQPILVLGLLALLFQWRHEKMDAFSTWPVRWQAAAVVVALALISALGVFTGSQFIYFQF